MPTIYVDVDAYLDAVVYAANDTIVARYGAILTVRESNTTLPFQIQSSDSIINVTTAQRKLVLNAAGYVNCVPGDIGLPVVGADTGDTGTLVDYNNATYTWHVLRDDPTDDQFDDVNEAISITGGTGAGTMNGAAAQAVILTFDATTNSGFVISGNGKLMTRGDWYPLGVGNGAAAQTFAFYGTVACPYVRVETGNGTGVYTDCRCVYNTPLTTYGAGVYMGNVFQHAPDAGFPITNLTFGNDVNGLAPPNGARVQCPDIFITSAAAYTATLANRSRVYYSTNGGSHDWQNVIFSDRFYFYCASVKSFHLTYVGVFSSNTLLTCFDVECSHLVISKDRAVLVISSSWYYIRGTFDHVNAEGYGISGTTGSCSFLVNSSSGIEISDSEFVTAVVTGTVTYPYAYCLSFQYCSDIELNEITIIGAEIQLNTCSGVVRVDGVRFSDSPSGAKLVASTIPIIYITYGGNFWISDITLLAGGSAPYGYAVLGASCPFGGVVKDISFDMDTRTLGVANFSSNSTGVIVANCTMTGTSRSTHVAFAAQTYRCSARNILLGSAMTVAVNGSGSRIEGIVSGTMAVAQAAVVDSMYQLTYDSAAKLTGFINLIMTPENELDYYDVLAGDVNKSIYFDNIGELYMKSIGDSCTFEIPYLIQGVSSFQNVAATILHATWSGNCTKEYAIKSGAYGSSWGAWTAFSAANLSAETVDSVVGFYMKFRFTMTGASVDNYCSRFKIPVNTDAAFSFPVDYVPVTLSELVVGSAYWVWDNTNARWLAQGVAAATSVVFDAPCDFDGADISITVRVRKGDAATYYDPWELTTTYSDEGTTVSVAQRASTVQTDVGEAFFSFDAINKICEVADTETEITVQDLVNAIREYETTRIDLAQILEAEGKADLTGGLYTGITAKLIDDWRLRFEDRAGPGWVTCSVKKGNLIATNAYGDDPIAPGAYVNTVRAMSTEAALLTSPAQDAQAVRDAMKLAPSAGAPAAGSIDAHLDDMPADVDTELSTNHGAYQWQKTRQYP